MATHARQGLSKFILGSCAEDVIRHAPCPVLTVGPNAHEPSKSDFSFSSIVFATDLSPDAPRQAALALSLAQDSVGKICLCHVIKDHHETVSDAKGQQLKFDAALQKLIPASSYDWCCTETIVEEGEVAPQILDLANRVNANLIVLGAKTGPGLLARFSGGVVGDVLAKAECPVMIIGAA